MTVEAISGVVAALAAVGAVYFARDTVHQTLEGRGDADKHHETQIAAMRAATGPPARWFTVVVAYEGRSGVVKTAIPSSDEPRLGELL